MGVAGQCILPTFDYLLHSHEAGGWLEEYVYPTFVNHQLGGLLVHTARTFRPILLLWAFAPVVGLLCVLTHWLLIRPPQGPQG